MPRDDAESSGESFGRIADCYDILRGDERRGDRFAVELARGLDPAEPVIDIGVGTGVVAKALAARGYQVVGVDVSWEMARRARDRIGSRVVVGDATRLPIADASFRCAISVWLLHVVGDLRAALAEVARVLVPGGRYLVVPARTQRPAEPVAGLVWDMYEQLDPTGRRDDLTGLLREAGQVGLEVAERWTCRPYRVDESPAEIIRAIQARSFPRLWDASEEQWSRLVEPMVASLRQLVDEDRQVARTILHEVVVLRKPGSTR